MKIHNPISTVTNFAYILLGYLCLPDILGFALIILGICSAGFHAFRNDYWHKGDIVAIYYVFAMIAGHLWLGDTGTVIGFVIGAAGHWSHRDYSRYSTYIIGSLGLLALGGDFYANGWEVLTPLGWLLSALAFGQVASRYEYYMDGKTYDVLHGIWHILSAVGIWELIR